MKRRATVAINSISAASASGESNGTATADAGGASDALSAARAAIRDGSMPPPAAVATFVSDAGAAIDTSTVTTIGG